MDDYKPKSVHRGEIKTLLLTPTRELATQIHREVARLGASKPGGLSAVLLSKSNASQAAANTLGGDNGVDVLVTTPMRLCAVMNAPDSRVNLSKVRMICLDEADRLLDGGDARGDNEKNNGNNSNDNSSNNNNGDGDDSDDDEANSFKQTASSFVSQIDQIISATPTTSIRALFSATMGPAIRELASTVLRNPVSITHGTNNGAAGANEDIEQSLLFVGKEEGKLLAIRQIVQKGLKPPVLIFLQSKERAQALFNELLYDGINVDVIHAGRSQAARDSAVTRFRTGETWVLIATDVIARGLDFKAVNLVINYDFPNSGVSYVHRIGRTGRNGRKGKAVTFFTENDFPALRSIANIMKLSGCDVPEWQLKMRKETHCEKKEREKYGVKRDDGGVNTESKYDREKKQKQKRFKQNARR
jgi:ATP-dependent RNA helicase DDX52/ROK1